MKHNLATPAAGEAAWIAELGWLRRVCRALVADQALAEDLAQTVWVDAVHQQPMIRGARLRGWLRTVARRRASKHRGREVSARQAESLWLDENRAQSSTGFAATETDDRLTLHRRLMDVIDELDTPGREAIVAYFFEGLDTSQLALRTGVKAGTLRQRRRRALERLRDPLDGE